VGGLNGLNPNSHRLVAGAVTVSFARLDYRYFSLPCCFARFSVNHPKLQEVRQLHRFLFVTRAAGLEKSFADFFLQLAYCNRRIPFQDHSPREMRRMDLLRANAGAAHQHFINGELVEVKRLAGGDIILADGRTIPADYRTFTHGSAMPLPRRSFSVRVCGGSFNCSSAANWKISGPSSGDMPGFHTLGRSFHPLLSLERRSYESRT